MRELDIEHKTLINIWSWCWETQYEVVPQHFI